MNLTDLGNLVKSKYQEYKDVNSEELAKRVVNKFPQYQGSLVQQGIQGATKVLDTMNNSALSAPAKFITGNYGKDNSLAQTVLMRPGAEIIMSAAEKLTGQKQNLYTNNKMMQSVFGPGPLKSYQSQAETGGKDFLVESGMDPAMADKLVPYLAVAGVLADVVPPGADDLAKAGAKKLLPKLARKADDIVDLAKQAKKYGSADGKYLYHGTAGINLDSISKEGLKPGMTSKRISLSKTEPYATSFAESSIVPKKEGQGVVFRVNADLIKAKTRSGNIPISDKLNELVTNRVIPPEALEIKVNGKWKPLTDIYNKAKGTSFAQPLPKSDLIQETKKVTHYSTTPGLGILKPEFQGTGAIGSEKYLLNYPEFDTKGVNLYLKGARPEKMVLDAGGNKYNSEVSGAFLDVSNTDKIQKLFSEAKNIISSNPEKYGIANSDATKAAFYGLIKKNGYSGLTDTARGTMYYFGNVPVVKNDILKNIVQSINEGGVTFDINSIKNLGGEPYTSVSLYPERSKIFSSKKVSPLDIKRYIRDNIDLLAKKNHSLGGWYDKESGQLYLDIVATVKDRNRAIELGKQFNQKAVFDLGSFEEIQTGGTGEIKKGMMSVLNRIKLIENL